MWMIFIPITWNRVVDVGCSSLYDNWFQTESVAGSTSPPATSAATMHAWPRQRRSSPDQHPDSSDPSFSAPPRSTTWELDSEEVSPSLSSRFVIISFLDFFVLPNFFCNLSALLIYFCLLNPSPLFFFFRSATFPPSLPAPSESPSTSVVATRATSASVRTLIAWKPTSRRLFSSPDTLLSPRTRRPLLMPRSSPTSSPPALPPLRKSSLLSRSRTLFLCQLWTRRHTRPWHSPRSSRGPRHSAHSARLARTSGSSAWGWRRLRHSRPSRRRRRTNKERWKRGCIRETTHIFQCCAKWCKMNTKDVLHLLYCFFF